MSTTSLPAHAPSALSSVSTGDGASLELPSMACTRASLPASKRRPPRQTARELVTTGGFASAIRLSYSRAVRHRMIDREQHDFRGCRHRAQHQHFAVERGDAPSAEVHRRDDLTSHELLGTVVH